MNRYYLLLLFTLLGSNLSCTYAQINSITRTDTLFCCSDEQFIDVELDGQVELRMASRILTDIGYIFAESSDSVRISRVTELNNPFTDFDTLSTISIGGVGCFWLEFEPGDPDHFLGVQRYENGDTLWSYLRLTFEDNDTNDINFCNVRIVVKETVYHTTPNTPLIAGQTTTTSINSVPDRESLYLYPNPTTHRFHFSDPMQVKKYQIYQLNGVALTAVYPAFSSVDISAYDNRIYLIKLWTNNGTMWKKIVKTD